jgi:diguanylate cyclase (GGDEF)-like protein
MATDLLPIISWIYNPGVDVGLPATVALAAVALIGYLVGQRTSHSDQASENAKRGQELARASGIAHQLEAIAQTLRQDLASHHGRLARFQLRLSEAQSARDDKAWQELCSEAELMLAPTMQLAQQLSLAYDSIRQQSDALETFSQARTDPITGVGNGRALEEKLDVLLSAACRSGADFSIALVSIDHDPNATASDNDRSENARLPELARLIQSCLRERDYVARYGDDEFVVVMPQTKLAGANIFGERLRKLVVERMSVTVSCGIAQYQAGDDQGSLLGRADSACYSAKAAGQNRQFLHTGTQIREHRSAAAAGRRDAIIPADGVPPASPVTAAPAAVLEPAHSIVD